MSGLFLGAMASRSASIYTQDATRQAIGATFRIEGNEENRRKRLDQAMDVLGDREGSYGGVTHKWLENGADMVVTDNSFETVKEDDVKKIAQVEGIEEYNLITIATVVNPVNFSRIEDSDMDQSTDVGGVNLRGNRIMEMDMDVSAGKISLIEGRMIEKDDRDVCVISKELAELNHLKTGNLLKFNDYHDKEHSTIYSAEIIGIYETKQERKSIMYGDSYRPENTIFTDMSFPEKPSGNEGNPFYQYAIFKVQNAGKYDQVKKSVQKANIDWSRYDLIDNNGNIKNMTENFGQMDQMSKGLLLIVSVSGLVILVLVFLFWIKNRTQEIGIMMSLGKCKFEIWVQFLWESSNDKYYRDVVILCNFPNYCRDFSFIFSERNADLKVRTAGTGKYWYLYRWIYCTGFKIQDVDNYVERVDNFVDMSEKGWDKTRKIAKKQEVVINMRAWKQGVQEKAVEKVIHALWKGNEQKNKEGIS